jgi:hypothetical protein
MKIRMTAPNYGGTVISPSLPVPTNSVYNFQTSQITIKLLDHAGTLTNGGKVKIGHGGWPFIGTTGDDGVGILYHEHFLTTQKFRMSFNGTGDEIQQDMSVNPVFVFQTMQAEIHLKDHNGNFMNGGKVAFGIGGWPVIGYTGDDATGKLYHEIFPGSYKYRLSFNYGTQEQSQNMGVVGSPIPMVFQTALVDFHFTGSIAHKVGGWPAFVGPIEMLPIQHTVRFSGASQPSKLFQFTPTAGTVYEKTVAYMRLLNSLGAGIAGAEGFYRVGGTYISAGFTDSDGVILAMINGHVTSTYFRMKLLGHLQTKLQNLSTNSFVIFQTKAIVVEMRDSGGALKVAEELFYRDGTGTYISLGSNISQATIEMLPLSYYFRCTYLGHTQTKLQNTAKPGGDIVTFQTTLVTVEMRDSGNNLLAADELLYRNGAGTYVSLGTGITSATLEMLPLSYYFRGVYLGHDQTLLKNVGTTPTITFQTVNALVELRDGSSNLLTADDFQYRNGAGTYVSIATNVSQANIEMLPLAYYFRCYYNSSLLPTKLQNVGTSSTVTFVYVTTKDAIAGDVEEGISRIYPNPVSTTATLDYGISEFCNVSIAVYDQAGNIVMEVENGLKQAGNYQVKLHNQGLDPGVYYCRVIAGDKTYIEKYIVR